MIKRTTIEIDVELLSRAKLALGRTTTRETVEEALRRAVGVAEAERAGRAVGQLRYIERLGKGVDLAVLKSEEMWR